jgi:hypothetical protein
LTHLRHQRLIFAVTHNEAATLRFFRSAVALLCCDLFKPQPASKRRAAQRNQPSALMKPAEEVLQRWLAPKRVNSSRAPDDAPTLIS